MPIRLFSTLIFFSLAFINGFGQSALVELSEEIDDLQEKTSILSKQLSVKESELRKLMTENSILKIEVGELKEAIIEKTTEVILLRGQLKDVLNDYERLIEEFNLLSQKNEQDQIYIKRLENVRDDLVIEIDSANQRIFDLDMELKQIGYENELLVAKNNALEERLNDILDYRVQLFFVEINVITPGAYDVGLSYGKLIKAKTLFLGGRLGYKKYDAVNRIGNLYVLDFEIIPITAQVRFPLSKRNFATKYVDPFMPFQKKIKYFGAIDFGYGLLVNSTLSSDFNRGGILAIASFGGIFNFFDLTNFYINTGFEVQSLKNENTNGDITSNSTRVGMKFGLGVTF